MIKRVTIKDIARLAGVNISTVSRTLNPETASRISAEKREKILALCDHYNYRPRVAARACVTGRSFRIGLILGALTNDLANPLHALYVKGVCSVLQSKGYTLSVLWAEEYLEKRDEVVKNFLMSEIADGYILGAPLLAPQTVETFRNSGHPILSFKTFQNTENKFPTLTLNPENAYRRIWKAMPPELAKNILFTGPDSPNTTLKKELFCNCADKEMQLDTLFFKQNSKDMAFHHNYLVARNFFNAQTDFLRFNVFILHFHDKRYRTRKIVKNLHSRNTAFFSDRYLYVANYSRSGEIRSPIPSKMALRLSHHYTVVIKASSVSVIM